ncbi:speckle-type POZ protein-like [Parasteatoda tepidariorum]|uniref:speckle-type POZ protein-like n=1 Tax=Parasteatoda tepidariorum TaxID=114398 RepID=UPI00077FB8BE
MSERTGKDDFIFTWIIEDFFSKSDLLISPEFTIESLQKTVWCVELYPKGLHSDKSVDLYLRRKDDTGPQSITVNYAISIIAANGISVLDTTADYQVFLKNSTLKIPKIWDKSDLLNKTNKYLLDNALTIQWRMWTCFAPEPAYNRCTAVTRSEAETASFKKSIKNFSAFYSGHRVTIPIPLNGKYEMILRMEKSGFGECLVISVRKGDESHQRLFCKLSLLSSAGIPLATKEEEHVFNTGKKSEWSFPPFTEFEELKAVSTFLRNDTLWLYCEMAVFTDKETSKITEKRYVPSHEESSDKMAQFRTLSNDLSIAYRVSKFTDVELVVEGESFYAHRFILSARSSVFKNMFQTDTFKSKNGRVEITNVDVESMDDFLKYLYTGSLDELDFDDAIKLFVAADNYMIPELKKECVTRLKKNVTPSNVCDLMNLSKTHQDETLKSAVEDCLYSHADEILASEEWKKLVINDVSLATEMLQKLTTKQRSY